jgi:hypothetical protein
VVLGDKTVIAVESAEGTFVGVDVEAACFARGGDDADDVVVGPGLAELEDMALVGIGKFGEFTEFFHGGLSFRA